MTRIVAPSVDPLVMGVLNVTPDSFSDGGMHFATADAVRRGLVMVAEGASVIDVGGESTRPGADPVAVDEEISRVVPVLEGLAGPCRLAGVRLSVDTRHEATARAAAAAGADLLNDVSASLAPVASELGLGWIAMHMAADPRTMQDDPRYDDVAVEVQTYLLERAAWANSLGVAEVWLDPGIGFGKTVEHNLALLGAVSALTAGGWPVVVGTSRKRFLGVLAARSAAGLPPVPEMVRQPLDASVQPLEVGNRRIGSLITAGWAMIHGARMVRVHDVAATVRLGRLLSGGPAGAQPGR